MRKVDRIILLDEEYDLAMGEGRVVLAKETVDLYGRPVALEVDLESVLSTRGNVLVVEALLAVLANGIVVAREREEQLAASLASAMERLRKETGA